jgi:hypothetical protein
MFVKVFGGIGKGREDTYLPIAGVDRLAALGTDKFFEMLELGVAPGLNGKGIA